MERALACTLRRLRFSRRAALNRRSRFILALFSAASFTMTVPRCSTRGVNAHVASALACFCPVWQASPAFRFNTRCRSSVVEHPLGKGEVHSSILCGSTIAHQRKSSPMKATATMKRAEVEVPDGTPEYPDELVAEISKAMFARAKV